MPDIFRRNSAEGSFTVIMAIGVVSVCIVLRPP
nr:MAG TPA: hypothetical protein [Caudoviricetes sp.]